MPSTRDTSIPSFLIPQDGVAINIKIERTQATITDPGITFNQAGVTFNDSRYTFGGLNQQNQDIAPMLDVATLEIPHIMNMGDIYTQAPAPPPPANKNGPGWFMFVNLT